MPDEVAETRKVAVQALRRCAKKCGVPLGDLCRDNAGKAKVEALGAKAAASGGTPEDKAAAAAALATYLATWETDSDEESEEGWHLLPQAVCFRVWLRAVYCHGGAPPSPHRCFGQGLYCDRYWPAVLARVATVTHTSQVFCCSGQGFYCDPN